MNAKIRNKFIEIKYNVSNGLVILITNYWWFRILEISTLRKLLRICSVISVNYHYITVLCPFKLLIRFKCCNTV